MAILSTRREPSSIRRILARAREVVGQEGVKSLWFKVLGDTVYRRMILLERSLQGCVPAVHTRVPITIDLLQETEIPEYLAMYPEADLTDIRQRFTAGHVCFVARHEGRLAAVNWASTSPVMIDYLGYEFRPAVHEVYEYDAYTATAYRGLHIRPALTIATQQHFRQAGYHRMVGAVVPENLASLVSLARAGWRPYATIGYMKIGPWRRYFYRVM